MKKYGAYLTLLLLSVLSRLSAQEVSVRISSSRLSTSEYFSIIIEAEGERIRSHDPFPELKGLVKRGTSSSSETVISGGKIETKHSITQHYLAEQAGTYQMPALELKINGKVAKYPATKLIVSKAAHPGHKPSISQSDDPFGLFFSRPSPPQIQKPPEDKSAAFLSLRTDKDEVFLGEGFAVSLAFYVAMDRAPNMEFHDLDKQIQTITQKIKPRSCWEESFREDFPKKEAVRIQGRRYMRYTLYYSIFYPFGAEETILFPSVEFKILKYHVNRYGFFTQRSGEELKTFYTKPKVVRIKPLPEHPLRDRVAVGQYSFSEKITKDELRTGEGFTYDFTIYGEGNISALTEPTLTSTADILFYPPKSTQRITKEERRVFGKKKMSYYGVPQIAGRYRLKDFISWIYFDPKREQYDTLSPTINVYAEGENLYNQHIKENQKDNFYAHRIQAQESPPILSAESKNLVKWLVTTLLSAGVLAVCWNFIKRNS